MTGRPSSPPNGRPVAIDESRPFEPLGMTTAAWADVAPRIVRLADLVLSQERVPVAGLLAAASGAASFVGDPYPHVAEYAGRLHLVDGHNRVLVALIRGERTIEARVLEGYVA